VLLATSTRAKTLGIRLSIEEKITKQILTSGPGQQPNQENNVSAANPRNRHLFERICLNSFGKAFKKIPLNPKEVSPTKKAESSSKVDLRDKTPQKYLDSDPKTKPKKDLQNNNLFQVYQNIKSPSESRFEQRIKTAKIQKEGMDCLKLAPDHQSIK